MKFISILLSLLILLLDKVVSIHYYLYYYRTEGWGVVQ